MPSLSSLMLGGYEPDIDLDFLTDYELRMEEYEREHGASIPFCPVLIAEEDQPGWIPNPDDEPPEPTIFLPVETEDLPF